MEVDNKKYVGLIEDGAFTAAPLEEKFLESYMSTWTDIVSTNYFKSESVDTGHKLRPRLVYWGFLAGNTIENININDVAQIAVAIELIHKSSLLLDDYIDKDVYRHNKPAFYITYGVERTIMYSLNLLSTSLLLINEIIKKYPNNKSMQFYSMQGLLQCMYDMSLGVLIELDTDMSTDNNTEKIKKIIALETSSLIQISLLMGYYVSNSNNENTEKDLKEIGHYVGCAFQLLNDLESIFGSTVNEHKGSEHNDIIAGRKNYCYAILQSLITSRERTLLSKKELSIDVILKKYNIKEMIKNEINNCNKKIDSILCASNNISELWKKNFLEFYESVISVYLHRLGNDSNQ